MRTVYKKGDTNTNMEILEDIILWAILKFKVALYNFKILQNYKKVQPCHYRRFIRAYNGFELVGKNTHNNVFYGSIESLKVIITLENGKIKVRRWEYEA